MTKTKTVRATKESRAKYDREPKMRMELKPKTEGQREYLLTMMENDITFVTGDAGTGKSFLAIGLACQHLLEGRFDYLIIARPTVEASPKGLGFLPGDLTDKISPYVYPAVESMKRFLGPEVYQRFFNEGIIKFEPLEYMRGRTYDHSFLILEEAQNCTKSQLVMFVSRIGEHSKMVINGDVEQSDLRNVGVDSDLQHVIDRVVKADLQDFGVAHLTESDIVRNPLIAGFLRAMK